MSEAWDENKYAGFSKRLSLLGVAFGFGIVILILRLWNLQIIHGEDYTRDSDNNSLRRQRLIAPRGMIYGRDGLDAKVILADNRAARDLKFVLAECDIEPETIARYLEEILNIDTESFLKEVALAKKEHQPYRHIQIKQDIPNSISARIEEMSPFLPGVFTVARPVRRYVHGKTAGQLLGYLQEVNQQDLDDTKDALLKKDRYKVYDLKGRRGVEKLYESTLRGEDGDMLVTKYATGRPQLRTDPYGKVYVEKLDSFGRQVEVVENAIEHAVPGNSVQLTLDIGLQEKCESLLKGVEGSIVVLNADTGAVLAMASVPGYDPSVFVSPDASGERGKILNPTKGQPNRMLNRSFQGTYPPGSTYKIMMAAMALEEGIIDANTTFFCGGRYRLPNVRKAWYCWKHSGHGKVNIVDAIAYSCDVFFYSVGRQAGVEKIKEWSTKFGWGVTSGLDLPGEVSGLVPSRAWKKKFGLARHPDDPSEGNWYPGETINISIGQGYVTATPLQCAMMMASVINGGRKVTPHINANTPDEVGESLIRPGNLALIQAGMLKCVEKKTFPSGTGWRAGIEGFTILGKTGSAQLVSREAQKGYNDETIPKHLRDHAWFMCGVMDREPQIAVCILVEYGHHGSTTASPMGKEVIQYFYDSLEKPVALKMAQESTR